MLQITSCVSKNNTLEKNLIKNITEEQPLIDGTFTLDKSTLRNVVNAELKRENFERYQLTNHKIISNIEICNDNVYILDNENNVVSFSLKERKIKWTHKLQDADKDCFIGGVSYDHGKLYVNNGSTFLIILDGDNGEEIFRKSFYNPVYHKAHVLSKNVVLVQTINNNLFAFDTHNTKVLWNNNDDMSSGSTKFFEHVIVSSIENPATNSIISFLGSEKIVCIDKNSGNIIWAFHISNVFPSTEKYNIKNALLTSKPIIQGENLYLTLNCHLLKINTTDGTEIWKKNMYFGTLTSIDFLGENILVSSIFQNKIFSFNGSDGKLNWIGYLNKKDTYSSDEDDFITNQQIPFLIISKSDNLFALNLIHTNNLIYTFKYDENLKKFENISSNSTKFMKELIECSSLNSKELLLANAQYIFVHKR